MSTLTYKRANKERYNLVHLPDILITSCNVIYYFHSLVIVFNLTYSFNNMVFAFFRKGGSSCATSDARRVDLVTYSVISHERGKNREVFATNGTVYIDEKVL
jgi:hypothetical protein